MQIRLLKDGYKKNELLYAAFKKGDALDDCYFSENKIEIDSAPNFPVYMGKGDEVQKKKDFLEAFQTLANSYIHLDRDIHFDECFWHSLLITKKRDYIIEKYPQVLNSYNEFKNIVIKNFDWENYIYKCILAVEYIEDIEDYSTELALSKNQYYELIVDNLDIYNYIIKYSIFRNGEFLAKILTVINNLGISDLLKRKITNRPDLGKDERYGRRVIFELNKAYPVLMSPMLDVHSLEKEFINILKNFYDVQIEIDHH